MNDLIPITGDVIDGAETGTAIALPTATSLEAMLKSKNGTNALLDRIAKSARAEAAKYDAGTAAGRKALISLANDASTSRAEAKRRAMALTEQWRSDTTAVNAGRKVLEDGLAALRDEIRRPVTAWETAEEERVDRHKAALLVFRLDRATAADTPEAIRHVIEEITAMPCGAAWQEYAPVAEEAMDTALAKYTADLCTAEQRVKDQAELARLRAKEFARAERDAAEAAAKAAADRAEQERADAERLAAEKVEADRIAEEQAEKRRADAVVAEAARREQAERDKADAADRARVEAQETAKKAAAETDARHTRELAEAKAREETAAQRERDRLAAEQKAEADARAKREADQAHRARIRNEIAAGLKTLEAGNWFALADALIDGKVPHTKVQL